MTRCLKCGGDGWLWCCELDEHPEDGCGDNRYLCSHCYPCIDNKKQICLVCSPEFHMCDLCDPKHSWQYNYCSKKCYVLRS
jgi:hypothetical protein